MDINKGLVIIDEIEIVLSLMEFCYYRYFIERAINVLGMEPISGLEIPRHIVRKVLEYHEESFPNSDTRSKLKEQYEKGPYLPEVNTLLSHRSKINGKIKLKLKNTKISKYYTINDSGKRFSKEYGLIIPSEKIKILKNEKFIS